jgi:hypothetical protein
LRGSRVTISAAGSAFNPSAGALHGVASELATDHELVDENRPNIDGIAASDVTFS